MDIDIGVKDIDWTHRIGTKTENKRRPKVCEVSGKTQSFQ